MHSPTNYRNKKKRKRNDIVDHSQPQSVSPAIANPNNNNTTGFDSSSAFRQQPMADQIMEYSFDRVHPIEYKFVPTDQELITHFLLNKINNQHLPNNKIGNVDIYQDHPQNIVGQWYFFTPRNRYMNSNKVDRKAGDGYWKAIKFDKEITDENGTKIGVKNSLVYHQGNDRIKTDWMMQEFVVAADHHRQPLDESDNKLYDYVLCKIYKKRNSGGRQQANTNQVVTDQDHHADPTIVRAPILDQEPRPEQRVTQYHPSMISNTLNFRHPSMGGLPRDIVNHDMRYGQPFRPRVPPPRPPYRPPPRPHVGLFDDERPNYIVRSSVVFNRSAGPSTSTNQQPLHVAPTPPYRPPPRPHVGHFPNEPNYKAVSPSAGFSRSAGPSTSTNPQPLPAPSDDYIWDLTELEQLMNSQKPKSPR
ncbi:hypothetical protein L6452_24666 [Arctium lappa]|uniref:Uncharacterized protein n=1 Tax=Arctium lappa TaxID=4217 RepID=A0ACB9AAB3_ARCLA|nr:hypothetical protein L6452_24666 [Arctium lappa]